MEKRKSPQFTTIYHNLPQFTTIYHSFSRFSRTYTINANKMVKPTDFYWLHLLQQITWDYMSITWMNYLEKYLYIYK